ncbi:MAG: hypothetical protein ACKV1O_19700 [Saprospiraceae bacterium]
MMEPEDNMLKGFNAGYMLQKFEPELAKVLLASLDGVDIPYISGFQSGAKEYILEKELEKSDLFPGMDEEFDLDMDQDLSKDDPSMDLEI